jgi:cytochrome oxidase assembly protein ShyY1
MSLHENLARWQLGRLNGDESVIASAREYMAREGISNPDRVSYVLVPLDFDSQ